MVNFTNENDLKRLWGDGVIRVFISHVAEQKIAAFKLKLSLEKYGIASFVAHEDIEPIKDWEIEIERALFSMDILVALLTEGFSESKWTDQEVGVAVGRRVPVLPVRLGENPYGFMARYQAIHGSSGTTSIADAVFSYVIRDGRWGPAATDIFITALANSGSFDRSNSLAKYLPEIDYLSPEQEDTLVKVFNSNSQVWKAFDFRRDILEHLKRATGNDYEFSGDREIRLVLTDSEFPF